MRGIPGIGRLLAHADGGIPTVIAALRLADDPDSHRFLDRFDAISETDKEYLSLEEICVVAEVAPKRLLELCVSALVEDSRSAGAIIAATYHPRVIRATAESAIHNPDAQSDRRVFLQGTGFTPQPANRPGGVFVAINNQLPSASAPNPSDGTMFNAAEDDLKTLHETIDGNRLLEAPKTVENASAITIGHTYKDSEELECIPSKK
jgi:hypothetical protein